MIRAFAERSMTKVTGLWRSLAMDRAPKTERLTFPSTQLDEVLQTLTDRLNLAKLKGLLAAADAGDLAQGLQLFEEMEQNDTHLAGVAATRRQALTGLDWTIESSAETQNEERERAAADEAAEYTHEALSELISFSAALKHLSTAIGTNLAVVELVWDGTQIADMVPVRSSRLRMDDDRPGLVRMMTDDERHPGYPCAAPDFVVHAPHGRAWMPFTRALTRAQAYVYLAKQLAIIDWNTFLAIFGMPIRWCTYRGTATTEEKRELAKMMENLGTKAWGVFSEAVQMQVLESSQRGVAPFAALIDWAERKQTALMLGGNLIADTTGGTGTFAASKTQDEVRGDLRDADIAAEAEMIRYQVLAPLVWWKFRRPMPLPHFVRVKPETVDRRAEAELINSAQRAGLKVPKAWAHNRLGIPEPQDGEEVLVPSLDAFGAALEEGGGMQNAEEERQPGNEATRQEGEEEDEE